MEKSLNIQCLIKGIILISSILIISIEAQSKSLPSSNDLHIWAVHDGLRLERGELNHPAKASNSVWNGKKISIFGAKNEVIAFQVIVQSTSRAIDSLSVYLPSLRLKSGQASIVYAPPKLDPTEYAGRPIQLFSVNYMKVTKETDADWIIDKSGKPLDPLGWKPVQLIPENAKSGMGGFPLNVRSNQNQAIWIEVYTARNLPSGVYAGTITVTADNNDYHIPVELKLFDFVLPDENSMHEIVYFKDNLVSEWHGNQNLLPSYHRFAHRNRIELVNSFSIAKLKKHAARFNGDAFTQQQKYEGPGEKVGNKIVPRTFYGTSSEWTSSDSWPGDNEFVDYLKKNIPNYITFLYMPDEPSPSDFPYIKKIANNVHSNPGRGKELQIFVTYGYDRSLAGDIDIWCSEPSSYDIRRAIQERSAGRDFWWYNGGRPHAGAFDITSPATDSRMVAWSSFKHGVRGHFYWHANHWTHNNSYGGSGSPDQNIWIDPITFNNGSSYANGDGVLIYPGQETIHPAEDRGIRGPISTLRMANLRRGLQDHQYLTLASALGKNTLVDEVLQEIVPSVFSDTGSGIGFSEDGNEYENARYRLALAIDGTSPPNPPTRPNPPTGLKLVISGN